MNAYLATRPGAPVATLADIIAPEGVSYDQEELHDDADVVGFVLDLMERPSPEFSIWYFLPQVSPKVYEDLSKRYQKALAG
mgnify:CR=1 FL=1